MDVNNPSPVSSRELDRARHAQKVSSVHVVHQAAVNTVRMRRVMKKYSSTFLKLLFSHLNTANSNTGIKLKLYFKCSFYKLQAYPLDLNAI